MLHHDEVHAPSERMVCSRSCHVLASALLDNVHRAYAAKQGPKSLFWTEGNHFDFYDQEPQVTRAVDAVASHFAEHLSLRLAAR